MSHKTCWKCTQPILPGQLYVTNETGEPGHHISCPSRRQTEHAMKFGRWTEAIAREAEKHDRRQSALHQVESPQS